MPDGIEQDVIDTSEENVAETTEQAIDQIDDSSDNLDLASILDNVLKEFENTEQDVEQKQEQKFWPNITTPVHESEATVLLEQLQKELETTKQAEIEAKTQQDTLLSDLEDLQTKYEISTKEVESYKTDVDSLTEFINWLSQVPVLWELVQLFADKWAEAVNIPKFLKDLHESNIMAQGASLKTEANVQEESKPSVSSFEQAMLRRNKR